MSWRSPLLTDFRPGSAFQRRCILDDHRQRRSASAAPNRRRLTVVRSNDHRGAGASLVSLGWRFRQAIVLDWTPRVPGRSGRSNLGQFRAHDPDGPNADPDLQGLDHSRDHLERLGGFGSATSAGVIVNPSLSRGVAVANFSMATASRRTSKRSLTDIERTRSAFAPAWSSGGVATAQLPATGLLDRHQITRRAQGVAGAPLPRSWGRPGRRRRHAHRVTMRCDLSLRWTSDIVSAVTLS